MKIRQLYFSDNKFRPFIFLLYTILITILINKSVAQTKGINDSSHKEMVEKKWEFDFQLDQRTSFLNGKQYSGNPVSINGLTIGWTFKNRFRIGFGGYLIKAQANKAFFIKYNPKIESFAPSATILGKGNSKSYLVQSKTQMYYFTPSFEYIFYSSKWLDLSIPIEIGVGYSNLSLTEYFSNRELPILNKNGQVIKGESIFFPALIGLSVMINLSPDVGLSASFGYRKILSEIGLSQNFDGLYYQIGLQLFPTNIKNNLKKDFKKWKAGRKKSN